MVHVRDIFEEFEKRDVEVLGITGQDPEELRKYLTFHDMPFKVLNDEPLDVVGEYGLRDEVGPPRGVIPRPAYMIVDPGGVIRYFYLSRESSDMPGDDEVLSELDGI